MEYGLTTRRAAAIVAICVIGLAGCGAAHEHPGPATSMTSTPSLPADAVRQGDIAVYGAYVREPANPATAAAYLTLVNLGAQDQMVDSISSDVSASAMAHDVPGSSGSSDHGGDQMTAAMIMLPPGGSLTLAPAKGHIMLDGVTKPLTPGLTVTLTFVFDRAGTVIVKAPVIAIGAPAPGQ